VAPGGLPAAQPVGRGGVAGPRDRGRERPGASAVAADHRRQPPFRRLRPSESLVKQGEPGDELFLLFDGVLAVEVDGQVITEVGPGAILGEMALLRGGRRTATLRAVTPCRVAVVPGERIDRPALEELAKGRTTDPAASGGGSSPGSEPA
jgi:Cyclic nucleotide-binding domain